jgi:hypothetical protein
MIVCALTTMRVAILIGIDSNIQSFLKKIYNTSTNHIPSGK